MDFTFVSYDIVECAEDHADAWPDVVKHWRIKVDGKSIGGIVITRDGTVKAARTGYGYRPVEGAVA